jgi:hypothetical protein
LALLKKSDLLHSYNKRQTYLITEDGERRFASKQLQEAARAFSHYETYDIFLSHSFDDARIVKIIKEMLEEHGYSVYVDWLEDGHLDRSEVSAGTALVLRNRMNRCSSLRVYGFNG